MIRHYCMLRKEVADHYGYPQYITFLGTKGRYHRDHTKVIQMSDYVIECDENGARYIKNREYNHATAIVDQEKLVWVKLSSVELDA